MTSIKNVELVTKILMESRLIFSFQASDLKCQELIKPLVLKSIFVIM